MHLLTWEHGITILGITIRIIAIITIGLLTARFIKKRIMREAKKMPREALRLRLLARMTRYTIYALTGLMIIRELGIPTASLMGLIGIAGVACGLAIKTSLANIFSGIFLMIEHPYDIGDKLTVNGITGTVTESNLYAIMLTTDEQTIIRIPHDKLIQSSIVITRK